VEEKGCNQRSLQGGSAAVPGEKITRAAMAVTRIWSGGEAIAKRGRAGLWMG